MYKVDDSFQLVKLKWLHVFCRNNRDSLLNIGSGCCFYCKTDFFKTSDIKEWVSGGSTALCPLCGINSVLPTRIKHCVGDEMEEYFVTDSDIEEMEGYWFSYV